MVYSCSGARMMASTGADSATLPAYMTITRSQIWSMTARSCEIKIMDIPCLRLMCFKRRRTCACTVTSSAVVGSSAIMSFGLQIVAMAIMTRCRIPPESWCGNIFVIAAGSGSPTSASDF